MHVSRVSLDRVGSGLDRSGDRAFREPKPGQPYFGPVYFRKDTEPYTTVAVAPGLDGEGVTVAEVNLKLVWDLVARIGIGRTGHAYVVDGRGQLVSHPDISRVLKKSDLSQLPQVRSALAGSTPPGDGLKDPGPAQDLQGNAVLTAHAPIAELGWLVFVEQPLSEAYAPLHASMRRSGLLLLVALALSVLASLFLARRMALPIRALQQGAARIGAGERDHRMNVSTGDELGQLAGELNRMAARLRESYGDLERKVAERTQRFEPAHQAKARFLRAASHDLRQPIHALGLFVDQLSARALDQETRRIATLAGVAVANLQDLLDAVLDISRLDAGVIAPVSANFAIDSLLQRLDAAFAPSAKEKGLRFRVVPSRLFAYSDPVLLERILLNLAANAVHYSERGGIVIGCRRGGDRVRTPGLRHGNRHSRRAAAIDLPGVLPSCRTGTRSCPGTGSGARDCGAPRAPARLPYRGRIAPRHGLHIRCGGPARGAAPNPGVQCPSSGRNRLAERRTCVGRGRRRPDSRCDAQLADSMGLYGRDRSERGGGHRRS